MNPSVPASSFPGLLTFTHGRKKRPGVEDEHTEDLNSSLHFQYTEYYQQADISLFRIDSNVSKIQERPITYIFTLL